MTKENELAEKITDILAKYIGVPNGHNPELYRKHFLGDLQPLIDDLMKLNLLSMQLGGVNAIKSLNRRGWSIHNSKGTEMVSSEIISFLYPKKAL